MLARAEPVRRLRFAQQQDSGASDLSLDGQLGLVEKGFVAPGRQFGGHPWMLGGVFAASQNDGFFTQVS